MSDSIERVPIGPFADWAARLIERLGTVQAARACEVDESYLRRIASGEHGAAHNGRISIDTVDRILIAEGSTPLQELYPIDVPGSPRRRGGGKPVGKYRLMTDDQVRAAHRLYQAKGLSCNDLGQLLWQRFGYANAHTCSGALHRAFVTLGLPRRSQSEVTIGRTLKHGRKRRDNTPEQERAYRTWLAELRGWRAQQSPGQPQCAGVKAQPPRKGSPCTRPSGVGSDYCWAHDPARAADRDAGLVEMRRRQQARDMVPIEPFATWVDQLHTQLGTLARVGRYLDRSTSTILNLVQRERSIDGVRQPVDQIDRATVQRYLQTARAQGLDQVPTYDELYATTPPDGRSSHGDLEEQAELVAELRAVLGDGERDG